MFTDIRLFEGGTFNLAGSTIKIEPIIPKNANELEKRLNQPGLKIVLAENDGIIRAALENKKTDILLIGERIEEKDFMHNRNSGLNKVLCDLAKKNNIIIAFSFSQMLNSRDKPKLLGRVMQNIMLCRKFKTKTLVATFAKNKWEMRTKHDLASLMKCLGMTPGQAKSSLEELNNILSYKKQNWVSEGIRIIE